MTDTPSVPARRSRQNGFTLLELLIAMSLLGLIFAALTGGLRFGAQAWRVGAERLADSEEQQLVHRTMRRQLAAALKPRQEGEFEGGRDRLSFVATAPARSMGPGLFHLTLGLVPDARHQALALSWRRLGGQPGSDSPHGAEPLLRGARAIEFSYFGDPDGGGTPRWTDRWPRDAGVPALPRLVRIDVRLADPMRAPWPTMILTVGGGSG